MRGLSVVKAEQATERRLSGVLKLPRARLLHWGAVKTALPPPPAGIVPETTGAR